MKKKTAAKKGTAGKQAAKARAASGATRAKSHAPAHPATHAHHVKKIRKEIHRARKELDKARRKILEAAATAKAAAQVPVPAPAPLPAPAPKPAQKAGGSPIDALKKISLGISFGKKTAPAPSAAPTPAPAAAPVAEAKPSAEPKPAEAPAPSTAPKPGKKAAAEKQPKTAAVPAPEEATEPKKGVLFVESPVDRMCYALENAPGNEMMLEALAAETGVDVASLERIGKILQEEDVCEMIYPVNVFSKPSIRLVAKQQKKALRHFEGDKLLSSYSLEESGVPANVEIWEARSEARPVYSIVVSAAGPYTEMFLNYLRDAMAREVPVLTEEITDPKKLAKLKGRFYAASQAKLAEELGSLVEDKRNMLAGMLLHRMYGLGEIELLMADNWLEEIGINSATEPIGVYHKKFGWLKTTMRIPSEEEIYNYASQIGRKAGRDITLLNPLMDANLLTGDRVAATLFPISSSGNTITIRRFARVPWTITDFISPALNTMSVEMAAFLWLCVQYEINIMVAGGTASGKTSALNTISALTPASQRIVSVEDTRELNLPKYLRWNWIPLTTRGPNPEGKGEVEMLDLTVAALRMRPDRVIVGEVRRKREAEVLFEAMHTGHAVYSTLHADNAVQAIRRLNEAPIEIPKTELDALHLMMVQYRDRRKGIRRTYEITELTSASGGEVVLNPLYKWRPRDDTFEKRNDSLRVFGELNMHTGMTVDEIKSDIGEKQKVLEWMLENKVTDIDKVGEVMNIYYKEPDSVVSAAKKKTPVAELLGEK
ncbi:MAG: ATPase, T2SS/T4P/T4SS family [Candidatus Micrarchaeota archaeon]|nr:ATPase, T2SS/T4P/T4SS family [Candidatus Micrarchaeota archaeon]